MPETIIEFCADKTSISPGECVFFSWRVENVKAIYFFHECQNWQDHGVTGAESRQECPSHSTFYYLRVIKQDGSIDVRQIPVQVHTAATIEFYADKTSIVAGESVTFSWKVENVKAVYFYHEGQNWQEHGVTGAETRQEYPPHSTFYYLRAAKHDGSFDVRQVPVQVQTAPDIEFNVDRAIINPGEYVTFSWHVEDVKAVHFFREGEDWQEHGVTGKESRQEFPPHSTSYFLRVTLRDGSVHTRQIWINVR
jgi:uncharacterized protein YciU (UPF0263 family)